MSRGAMMVRFTLAAALLLGFAGPALALPTMIRLGYANCAACHIAPQGGGPLNAYGRGIDEAQSLRSDEYRPSESGFARAISAHGRILQDVRLVVVEQGSWAGNKSAVQQFRPRLMYRNVTTLGKGFRVSATVTGETEFAPRPSLRYDSPTRPSQLFVNTALVHYRPSKHVEFAAGRDQLPTGINVPDLAAYIKSRNDLGYYDAPLQVKMALGGKRYQVMPYVYAPSGNEPGGERESGAGAIAEVDLFGTGKTVVGVTLAKGDAVNAGRQMVGAYTRLGFGRWGILAEHDITDRTRAAPVAISSFRQQATYAQVFFAVREWLVASAIGERLVVDAPFTERLNAGKLELAARFTNQASIGVSARAQRNQVTGVWTRSLMLQLALKSAQ